jgi:Flp pilus assembly protein TadD
VLAEKQKLYQNATKLMNSWKSHNNLAAVYIEQATKLAGAERANLADKAITHLEIAKGLKEDATVLANLGAAYLLKGNLGRAAENLQRAGQLRPDDATRRNINSMKGAVLIRLGKYEGAATVLTEGNAQDVVAYNRGLARLLSRNYDAAQSAFEEAVSQNANLAVAHYALAVVGARKKDEALMAKSLTAAIKVDDKLRARAVNDLEFMNYAGSDAFKNAIK